MSIRKYTFALTLAGVLATLGQNTAHALPLCTGSLSSLISGGPCTDPTSTEVLTFIATTGSNRSTTDANINVSVTNTAGVLDVQFLPNAASGFDLTSPAGLTGHYNFHYTVTSPGLVMINAQLNIFNPFVTPPGGGAVSGFKEIDNTYEADTPTDSGNTNFTTLSNSVALPNLPSPVTVEDDITIQSFAVGTTSSVGNGAAHPGGVENLLSLTTVPEPVSSALCGLALLAFGMSRRRLKK
ncbi:MAG TPA: hypothetical protein VKU19_31765 [Bryobacteraceae bacterium]|nr:hypothetical protein [Bryobacteraceae bacterium]